ncbi:bifunctional riboflavin kinase/FAD synthetase [uncultured Clostridium sp.]|uniref:bifunctional riboflavin kinase/FAD synthetase n=1 Tax=uncultured Clostridium sp. TaxID=59620 RepID=UPI0025F1F409|nr:bifunctional riboflavin kinase/FAD synthetase [uncultured Clostridium sp.]
MLVYNNKAKNHVNYIALGNFDGLHKGHLTLIDKVIDLAKENKGKSIIYTFENHPKTLIDSNAKINLLLDNNNKEELLKNRNVDIVYLEKFTEEFMKKSPEDFIAYIVEKFKIKGIVVGFNYRFGYKNMGDTNLLKELSSKYNFEVFIMEPCKLKDKVISSTRIRKELLEGNIEDSNKMLTRPYFLEGKVVSGKQIGRTIGFPTANLEYSKFALLPKEGVYYTNIMWNDKIFKGITSVGNNPTVNGKNITVETFILEFNKDIYGDTIKVFFLKKIRDNKKFNSLEELKTQLSKDKSFSEKEKYM